MSLVELLVAMTLLIVVITIGFVVTATLVRGTNATQRSGALTGTGQNGMQVLRDLFAGAVPARVISTPSGGQLYNNGCSNGSAGQAFPSGQGPFVSASATDVVLCSVRSGGNTAYTYHVYFSSGCTTNGTCSLVIDQDAPPTGLNTTGWTPSPLARTIETVSSVVCGACNGVTTTLPFAFSTSASAVFLNTPSQLAVTTANLSSIQAVKVTLTLATATKSSTSNTTATFSSQVLLSNALGGLL
jgi:hypothetical protein